MKWYLDRDSINLIFQVELHWNLTVHATRWTFWTSFIETREQWLVATPTPSSGQFPVRHGPDKQLHVQLHAKRGTPATELQRIVDTLAARFWSDVDPPRSCSTCRKFRSVRSKVKWRRFWGAICQQEWQRSVVTLSTISDVIYKKKHLTSLWRH